MLWLYNRKKIPIIFFSSPSQSYHIAKVLQLYLKARNNLWLTPGPWKALKIHSPLVPRLIMNSILQVYYIIANNPEKIREAIKRKHNRWKTIQKFVVILLECFFSLNIHVGKTVRVINVELSIPIDGAIINRL